MADVFAFTGIAGTGVGYALRTLKSHLDSHDPPIPTDIIPIDTLMWRAFCADARKDKSLLLAAGFADDYVPDEDKPNWWHLLRLPFCTIRRYWKAGVAGALGAIDEAKAGFVFLHFHANYQSEDLRWRLSAADVESLRPLKIRACTCLIDDTYDVHCRRTEFRKYDRQNLQCPGLAERPWDRLTRFVVDSAQDITQLVTWRQEEIANTSFLAHQFQCPFHIFAIKHPRETARKLLQERGASWYLSHPITSVRGNASFPGNEELEAVTRIAHHLRGKRKALIEPTTIDEFRFKMITVPDVGECLIEFRKSNVSTLYPSGDGSLDARMRDRSFP